ncbi:MAG: EipB family protein [Candidatus Puniceispirillales bacterium WSBS_2018_MAG_OTU23]
MPIAFFGAFLGIFFRIAASLAATPDALISYQAVYDIELKSSTAATNIKAISGQTHYIFEDVCDGWRSVEDYALSFGFGGDAVSNFISHYETWEAKNGDSFSFSSVENSNIKGTQKYDGFANIYHGVGESYHSIDGGISAELPIDTMFPTSHMLALLKQAKDGARLYQSNIFLGGDASSSLYLVSAVMGKKRDTAKLALLGAVGQRDYWPVRIAYFNPNAIAAEPEYEIAFDIQDNGVIQNYSVDYGGFVMQANMTAVKPLDGGDC